MISPKIPSSILSPKICNSDTLEQRAKSSRDFYEFFLR